MMQVSIAISQPNNFKCITAWQNDAFVCILLVHDVMLSECNLTFEGQVL